MKHYISATPTAPSLSLATLLPDSGGRFTSPKLIDSHYSKYIIMRKNNIITLIGSALVVCCYSSCCNKMNQDDALAYGQLMANEIKNIQSSDNAMTRATRMSQTRRKIMKFMDDNHICHPDNVTIGSEAYYEAITNMAYDLLEKRNDVSFSH